MAFGSFPLIGITTFQEEVPDEAYSGSYIQVPRAYSDSILRAGGLPILLPIGVLDSRLDDFVVAVQGILLSGGGDIEPSRFQGEEHLRISEVDWERDEQEIKIVQKALEFRKPLLGICRGIQVINVAFGGSLYTDIHDQCSPQVRHDCYPDYPRDFLAHRVELNPSSRLYTIFEKSTLQVNSIHHQGIKTLGGGLLPSAWSEDGLVEGVEREDHPFLIGVQWHPEAMPYSPDMDKLFRAFVHSATANRLDK